MSPEPATRDRSDYGGVLLVAIVAGAAIGVPLAFWTASLNRLAFPGEYLLLAAQLTGLYTVLSIAIAVVPSLALALLGVPPTKRRAAALLAAGYLFVNGATRYVSSVQLLSVTPHMTVIGLLDAAVVVTAAAALGGLIAARRSALGVGIAAALIAALELVHQLHEPARELDLSMYASAATGSAPELPAPAPPDDRLRATKLAILGLDGLSWEVLIPLLERSECPNFRSLLDGAAIGHLATLYYPRSPALWETMATGRNSIDHGIGDHSHLLFPGIERSVGHFPYFPLANSLMTVNRLLVATSRFAPWNKRPSGAADALAARFWEVASRRGTSVGIYNWLNTTPAAPVRGFLWGFGSQLPKSYPVDLDPDWERPPGPPAAPGMEWIEGSLPVERAEFSHFLELARRFDPELLAYYTHFGDGVNHLNWKREAHDDAVFFPGLRTHDFEPGPGVTLTMRFLDGILGEFLRVLPPDATFMVISDHGFDFRGYEHDNSPSGVVIVRGPEIRPGLIEGASLYDVAPTVLHLLGLPVADDMEAGPLRIAAPGSSLDRVPERVATHGPAAQPSPSDEPGEVDTREHEEYLRALGYVN